MHFINKGRNRIDFLSITDLCYRKCCRFLLGAIVLTFLEWLMTTYQRPKDHVSVIHFFPLWINLYLLKIDAKKIFTLLRAELHHQVSLTWKRYVWKKSNGHPMYSLEQFYFPWIKASYSILLKAILNTYRPHEI